MEIFIYFSRGKIGPVQRIEADQAEPLVPGYFARPFQCFFPLSVLYGVIEVLLPLLLQPL